MTPVAADQLPMLEMKSKAVTNHHPPVKIVINEATDSVIGVSEGASSSQQSVKSIKKTHCSIKKARKKQAEQKVKQETSCCLNIIQCNKSEALANDFDEDKSTGAESPAIPIVSEITDTSPHGGPNSPSLNPTLSKVGIFIQSKSEHF